MNRAQKLLVGAALIALAAVLHVWAIDWVGDDSGGTLRSIARRIVDEPILSLGGTKLYPGGDLGSSTALVVGLVLPLALVAAGGYLLLGFRGGA